MKRVLLSTFFTSIILSPAFGQTQYHLGTSGDGISDYTILNVVADQKLDVMESFTRIKPVDGKMPEFRDQALKARQRLNLSVEDFEKLAYYRRKTQYSCKTQKFRIIEVTYYDTKGKEIDKEESSKARWEAIPAGSMRELEFKKACN